MAETLRLEIVTPQAIVFSEDVHMVTLPVLEGQIGVYPQHLHLITQMVPGELIVHKDGKDTFPRRRRGAGGDHRPPCLDRHRHGDPGRRASTRPRPKKRASAPRPGCRRRSPTRKSRRSTPRWRGRWRSCRYDAGAGHERRDAALRRSPFFEWLPEYRAEWVRPDVVAGLTLAAYLLPAGIGDASLAGPAARSRTLRLPVLGPRLLALLQLDAARSSRSRRRCRC